MNITEIVAIIVIVILMITYLVWQIYKKGLRKTTIDLIVQAEKKLNDNEEKFNTVVSGIILRLPMPFDLIITESMVRNFVQNVFDEVKKALDYNPKEVK